MLMPGRRHVPSVHVTIHQECVFVILCIIDNSVISVRVSAQTVNFKRSKALLGLLLHAMYKNDIMAL